MGLGTGLGRGRGLLVGLAVALSLAGCGVESVGFHGGLVCPRCLPQSVNGIGSWWLFACALERAPLTEDTAGALKLATQLRQAQGAWSAPFQWTYAPVEMLPPLTPPTGYRPRTSIDMTVAFGDPVYYGKVPVVEPKGDCPPEIDVPAVIDLSTGDGAIAPTRISGTMRIIEDDPVPWTLRGQRDLAGVPGNLDLRIDPWRPQRGNLSIELLPGPEGLRGQLSPMAVGFDNLEQARSIDPLTDYYTGILFDGLNGAWPAAE